MAALFIAGCDGAEVFQPIDCTLDDVAAFVSQPIESRWGAATIAFAQSVFLRIAALRANTTHAPVLDLLSIMACAIGSVYAQARWTLARASSSRTGHANGIEHRPNLGSVTALPSSDHDRQWQAVPLDTQMDFAGDATPGSAQPLVLYGPLFSAAGNFLRAPEALRWALT
jgi:hypothetical protein